MPESHPSLEVKFVGTKSNRMFQHRVWRGNWQHYSNGVHGHLNIAYNVLDLARDIHTAEWDSCPIIGCLRPLLLASVFPPAVVGLWSVIYRTRQCRLVVIFRFPVLRQKRSYNPQCLNFCL